MKFSIMEFYLEPGVSIEVPPEMKGKCTNIINRILAKTEIATIKPEWVCSLNIIPSKKRKEFFLGPATILRKDKYYSYTGFFPFSEVEKLKRNDVSKIYIKHLLETVSKIYFKEVKEALDQSKIEKMLEKMYVQAKKTPVLKDNGEDDIF